MPPRLNLKDKKFNYLTVLEFSHINKAGQSCWHCQCDCGNKTIVVGGSLTTEHTKSCGCFSISKLNDRSRTHGLTSHQLYDTYRSIKARCFNKKHGNYKNYGERGVTLFAKWIKDPKSFFDYVENSLGAKPSKNHTIDRINNNGNYEPGNIRWATKLEQAKNRRIASDTIWIYYKTLRLPLKQLAKTYNVNYSTLRSRIFKYNWNIEEALKGKRWNTKQVNFR